MSNKMQVLISVIVACITLAETKDTECKSWQYFDREGQTCHDCTICQIGTYEWKACTNTSDRVCHCHHPWQFLYRGKGGNTKCFNHTICPGIPLKEGTPSSDTVCGNSTSSSKQQPTTTSETTPTSETIPTLETTPTSETKPTSETRLTSETNNSGIGVIAGIVVGVLFILLIIPISWYYNKKRGGDWVKHAEDGDIEKGQPYSPVAREGDVNEEEEDLLKTTNEELDNGEMEDTGPDEIEAIQLSDMEDKPDSPINLEPETTIIVNHVPLETEFHNTVAA